jgi:PTS system nitrogen regulatory IIA component
MYMTDLLSLEAVRHDARANGKKQVLRLMADLAATAYGVDEDTTFNELLERERLGSTGVGNGVAIPHARVEGIKQIRGAFARLVSPAPFEAVDDAPVDLVFLLLAPDEESSDHLKALAKVSRLLRRQEVREKLRSATSKAAIHALLTGNGEQ